MASPPALFDYRPLRASPILTALLLVLAVATLSALLLPATTRGVYPPVHLALPTLLLALLM
ncbi:MAG: hypothetical protein HY558_07390, partial [Euryarchaeota archaeon]|nr:hypothetical protein [Euryarchaeota archaeon]